VIDDIVYNNKSLHGFLITILLTSIGHSLVEITNYSMTIILFDCSMRTKFMAIFVELQLPQSICIAGSEANEHQLHLGLIYGQYHSQCFDYCASSSAIIFYFFVPRFLHLVHFPKLHI
jgi:hypothetical protein